MMEFIYDRTQKDVDRAAELNKKYAGGRITESEKQEWMGNLKGALNLSDLNRIEGNLDALARLFQTTVQIKNWVCGEIPRAGDYKRILDNVQKIRDAWFVPSHTPPTPVQPLNTYGKWNDIERILHDLHETYERYRNNICYCGAETYAGEGIGDL